MFVEIHKSFTDVLDGIKTTDEVTTIVAVSDIVRIEKMTRHTKPLRGGKESKCVVYTMVTRDGWHTEITEEDYKKVIYRLENEAVCLELEKGGGE